MPGSGLRGLGARTTQREPAFSAGTGRRESARGRMRRLVLREASHSRALDTITISFGTISFGSPFGSPISLAPLTFSNGLPEGAEIEAMLAAHRKWVGRPASLP